MIREYRQAYNREFTKEKYDAYIRDLSDLFPGQLDFRVAESPVFVDSKFRNSMLSACESIIDVIQTPSYQKESERAIPSHLKVPNESTFPHFIAFDFGVCQDDKGNLEPQLIEMQGFPSLFAWQVLLPKIHQKHFKHPADCTPYLNGLNEQSYLDLMREILVSDNDKHTILLEILPHQQKTRVDFYATEKLLGIPVICITELQKQGKDLFYQRGGKSIAVHKIYNRVIFDDLAQQPPEVQEKGKIFQEELNITWLPHPNWFFRLSKFTLPFINHPNVPPTEFLNLDQLPNDLDQFVVKPLFSFAGQGVIIDVTKEDIAAISDPENWIIQRKVQYAEAIETPDDRAKAEIRIFYFWEEGSARPKAVCNLARLSKGKMIGVRYNKDKDWVGGTFCLFRNQ